MPVHPRMRGERSTFHPPCPPVAGSSPHARGTPHAGQHDLRGQRFIPACAGNATRSREPRGHRPVHPRMRGERWCGRLKVAGLNGSSPHARGTRTIRRTCVHPYRFIPACAGNAVVQWARLLKQWVHPRMRGERLGVSAVVGSAGGSSPHARGTLEGYLDGLPEHRFIPACAGNARSPRGRRSRPSVHPRMRGERTSNKLLIYRRKSEPSDSTKRSGC